MKRFMELVLLAALATGCSTVVSQNEEALCGPRPSQAEAVVQN